MHVFYFVFQRRPTNYSVLLPPLWRRTTFDDRFHNPPRVAHELIAHRLFLLRKFIISGCTGSSKWLSCFSTSVLPQLEPSDAWFTEPWVSIPSFQSSHGFSMSFNVCRWMLSSTQLPIPKPNAWIVLFLLSLLTPDKECLHRYSNPHPPNSATLANPS